MAKLSKETLDAISRLNDQIVIAKKNGDYKTVKMYEAIIKCIKDRNK